VEIPYQRWYKAVFQRRSRRLYNYLHIERETFEKLISVCNNFRPFDSARAIITENTKGIFKGIIGAYGKIRGSPSFIAFIGDMRDRNVQEKAGYTGEGIILEATSLGLGTCWVGKSFDPEIATSFIELKEYEKVIAVASVGYASLEESFEEKILTGFGKAHHRKPLGKMMSGIKESELSGWIREALVSARLAPSAVNRQPWRFFVEENSITVSVDNLNDSYGISKRLDCGIAMLHIEVAALYSGVSGKWEFLEPPDVAKFKIESENSG
jgi:nitroreductase